VKRIALLPFCYSHPRKQNGNLRYEEGDPERGVTDVLVNCALDWSETRAREVSATEETRRVQQNKTKKGNAFTSTVSILGYRSCYSAEVQRNMTQCECYITDRKENFNNKEHEITHTYIKRGKKVALISVKSLFYENLTKENRYIIES
jgi:hypothetical protein